MIRDNDARRARHCVIVSACIIIGGVRTPWRNIGGSALVIDLLSRNRQKRVLLSAFMRHKRGRRRAGKAVASVKCELAIVCQ